MKTKFSIIFKRFHRFNHMIFIHIENEIRPLIFNIHSRYSAIPRCFCMAWISSIYLWKLLYHGSVAKAQNCKFFWGGSTFGGFFISHRPIEVFLDHFCSGGAFAPCFWIAFWHVIEIFLVLFIRGFWNIVAVVANFFHLQILFLDVRHWLAIY